MTDAVIQEISVQPDVIGGCSQESAADNLTVNRLWPRSPLCPI